MRNKLFTLLLLFTVFGLGATAQTQEFTLTAAQDYAIKHNYQAKNAIIDVAIAARKVKETIAGGLPQATANVSYNNFINLATSLVPGEFFGGEPGTYMEVSFGTKHNASIDGQLTQLLFSGSYFVGLKASKAFQNMSELQLEQVEQDVKTAIANAYFLVLISEKNKKLMQETIETMEKLLSDTKAMFDAGFMEDTDVDRINLVILDLKTSLLNADNQIQNALYLLKFNLGLNVTDEISLTDNLETILLSVNPEIAMKEDFKLKNHISYRLLENQARISELQVSLAKTEYMPVASGFLSQAQNAQRNSFNFFDFSEKWFPTTVAGVQISIPIFSSGVRIHKVKQSVLELEKTKNSLSQVSESLVMGAVTARNNFEVSVATYEAKVKNFDLAKKIYSKDQMRYKSGVASSTDLNQSYNTLLESQGTYLGAIMDMLGKKLELDKAYSKI